MSNFDTQLEQLSIERARSQLRSEVFYLLRSEYEDIKYANDPDIDFIVNSGNLGEIAVKVVRLDNGERVIGGHAFKKLAEQAYKKLEKLRINHLHIISNENLIIYQEHIFGKDLYTTVQGITAFRSEYQRFSNIRVLDPYLWKINRAGLKQYNELVDLKALTSNDESLLRRDNLNQKFIDFRPKRDRFENDIENLIIFLNNNSGRLQGLYDLITNHFQYDYYNVFDQEVIASPIIIRKGNQVEVNRFFKTEKYIWVNEKMFSRPQRIIGICNKTQSEQKLRANIISELNDKFVVTRAMIIKKLLPFFASIIFMIFVFWMLYKLS